MSDTDRQARTMLDTVNNLGGKLLLTMPGQFLALLVVNVIFLAVTMWFLDSQIETRTELVKSIITRCMDTRFGPEHT